jgi:hypothetical protein
VTGWQSATGPRHTGPAILAWGVARLPGASC